MMYKNIVQNQKVTGIKIKMSRELRKNETEAESFFWGMVRNRKFFNLKFRRQQIIDGFITDFFCNEIGLVVEIDGPVHDSLKQKEYDNERDSVFKKRGIIVLRFINDEILLRPDIVVEKIKEVLRLKCSDLTLGPSPQGEGM